MTSKPKSSLPKEIETRNKQPLLIENIYEKETAESYIERHFTNKRFHRCRMVAEFEVSDIEKEYGSYLVRSTCELEEGGPSHRLKIKWTSLVFQITDSIFWHFTIKSGNSYNNKEEDKGYTLVVTAESSEIAVSQMNDLHTKFITSDDAPGFFMVRDIKKPRRIPLKPEYALSSEMLELHYGQGFDDWSLRFTEGLRSNGLSILRGKPGTGKTSYLRHLIYVLSPTHRFYYVPVDSFNLLQAQMAEFLTKERKKFPNQVLVVVLEDAEQLLLDRRGGKDSLASSLLNFTDGFVSDMIKSHLICTINSDLKHLDEAVLRPGRQRFFREFELLDFANASTLASKLGCKLPEKRSYSLAEIYHINDVLNQDRLNKKEATPIGFFGDKR